jgi:outer membrane protein OmpA-like peptidoglycan-associated protein
MGATQPVARETNQDGSDSPEGRQKNRRVRIVISKAS